MKISSEQSYSPSHTHTHTHTHTPTHTHTHTHTDTHAHSLTHTHTHTYKEQCAHTPTWTYELSPRPIEQTSCDCHTAHSDTHCCTSDISGFCEAVRREPQFIIMHVEIYVKRINKFEYRAAVLFQDLTLCLCS